MSYGPPFNEAELAARRKTDELFAKLRRMTERQRKSRSKTGVTA